MGTQPAIKNARGSARTLPRASFVALGFRFRGNDGLFLSGKSSVRDLIRAAPIDRLDAELIAAHLLGVDRSALLLNEPNTPFDSVTFNTLAARRAAGEPLAYITGHREFWSLDIAVTPDTLIPRPDSETLIEAAVAAHMADAAPRILDLGTGSGCLLLAALSVWPRATGIGVDASAAPLAVARGNAERLGFADRAVFRPGDWATGLDERFDIVLANPPYVANAEPLPRDVAEYEPPSALFAGPDGLAAYRRIVPDLPRLLALGGSAHLEIGATQADLVMAMGKAAGLSAVLMRDLAGHPRCVTLRPC